MAITNHDRVGKALDWLREGLTPFVVRELGARAEVALELCYSLTTLCERKKRTAEALGYNGIVQSRPETNRLAQVVRSSEPQQGVLEL